jgi:hypothetical protein
MKLFFSKLSVHNSICKTIVFFFLLNSVNAQNNDLAVKIIEKPNTLYVRPIKVYLHVAGMPLIGSRYGVLFRVYHGLNIDASYGNSFLDYFGISNAASKRIYGFGIVDYWSFNKRRTLSFGLGLNNFFFQEKETYNVTPTQVLRSNPYISILGCSESGLTFHIRTGLLFNVWDNGIPRFYSAGLADGMVEIGIGYTLKVY